jgi:hypothetical protein
VALVNLLEPLVDAFDLLEPLVDAFDAPFLSSLPMLPSALGRRSPRESPP